MARTKWRKSQTWSASANKSQIKRDVYGLIGTFRCTFDCHRLADVEAMRSPFFIQQIRCYKHLL